MTHLQFTVYAVPVAQPRQRHRIVNMRAGKSFVHNYTPAKDPVNAYKYELKQKAKVYMDGAPLLEGPLRLSLDVYLPRPKKYNSKKYPDGAIWHQGRKDLDNLAKSVMDALTQIVWHDDGQVCWADVAKRYHERDGAPRVQIEIWCLE